MTPEKERQAVVFGTGDFARIAAIYLEADSHYSVAAHTVHREHLSDDVKLAKPVVAFETLTETHPPDEFEMLVAVGYSGLNQRRAAVYEECKRLGYRCLTYVHSSVTIWDGVSIGDNTFIFEENVIQPGVTIGNDVVLWSGNHIGHDGTIGDHVFIASHAVVSGNVTIGPYTFVGVNATFRDAINVGARNLIGAGALILHDTNDGDVFAPKQTPVRAKKSWELNF